MPTLKAMVTRRRTIVEETEVEVTVTQAQVDSNGAEALLIEEAEDLYDSDWREVDEINVDDYKVDGEIDSELTDEEEEEQHADDLARQRQEYIRDSINDGFFQVTVLELSKINHVGIAIDGENDEVLDEECDSGDLAEEYLHISSIRVTKNRYATVCFDNEDHDADMSADHKLLLAPLYEQPDELQEVLRPFYKRRYSADTPVDTPVDEAVEAPVEVPRKAEDFLKPDSSWMTRMTEAKAREAEPNVEAAFEVINLKPGGRANEAASGTQPSTSPDNALSAFVRAAKNLDSGN